jgi:hypothetical protein
MKINKEHETSTRREKKEKNENKMFAAVANVHDSQSEDRETQKKRTA